MDNFPNLSKETLLKLSTPEGIRNRNEIINSLSSEELNPIKKGLEDLPSDAYKEHQTKIKGVSGQFPEITEAIKKGEMHFSEHPRVQRHGLLENIKEGTELKPTSSKVLFNQLQNFENKKIG